MAQPDAVHEAKNRKQRNHGSTKFFVFVDYLFLFIFLCFLFYILLGMFTV